MSSTAALTSPRAGSSNFAEKLSDFWSDDFTPLQAAGQAIVKCLREDEAAPDADLYRRVSANGPGSHLYYPAISSQQQQQQATNNNNNEEQRMNGMTGIFSPLNGPRRMDSPGNRNNSGFFPLPQAHPPLMSLKHLKTVPLPHYIQEKQQSVRLSTFMGILAPAGLAWMSVDETLFLWSIKQSSSPSFCSFTVPSRQSIVSVGLVKPKIGVFKMDVVEWCLVVTTADEVILCALARTQSSSSSGSSNNNSNNNGSAAAVNSPRGIDHGGASLRVIPTSFSLPTDNVRIVSVGGTKLGRIFLGGEDGCLYEMTYEGARNNNSNEPRPMTAQEKLDNFYDKDENLPSVITTNSNDIVTDTMPSIAKRAWQTMSLGFTDATYPGGEYNSGRPQKCRKVNRTSTVSSALSNVLPEFLVRGTSLLFGGGTSTGGGKIVQIVVDEDRECLYTLSSKGWICSFDLRNDYAHNHNNNNNNSSSSPSKEKNQALRSAAVMDSVKTARSYLEVVQRGQIPPLSSRAPVGDIVFPGGSTVAQANVGGMEGARTILRREQSQGAPSDDYRGNILKPVSIHVVPTAESSRLTLVAITAGGLRLYISSLSRQVINNGPGNAYGSNRGTNRQNSISPSNKLTMCLIRAPPPLTKSGELQDIPSPVDSGIIDGVSPRVTSGSSGHQNSSSKLSPLVDASVYSDGIFVSAVRDEMQSKNAVSRRRRGQANELFPFGQKDGGDMIISLLPDSVKRRDENAQIGNSNFVPSNITRPELVAPGGVSETVMLPMATASADGVPLLPGGVVCDIAIISFGSESAIANLALRSRTPTDNELSVGLPPQYIPAWKTLSSDGVRTSSTASSVSSNREIVVRNESLSLAALKIFTNVFLSRPLGYGVTSGASTQTINQRNIPGYRISKRVATKGFSSTAGETGSIVRSSVASIPAKTSISARLRPWLLQPDPVPLNPLASQYFKGGREVVALNAGGLHYFGFDTALSKLAEALVAAGENVRNDTVITSYFKSYGYREGCAMCLALAIGCGPSSGNTTFNAQMQRRAEEAALGRAFVPKLIPYSSASGNITSGATSATDPLIPFGYEFLPSALSEGLTSLVSRLVRPIWHKPAVVVTEGRAVKTEWSNDVRLTPAKVELLMDESALKDIGDPLRNLLERMKHVFSRAVTSVPGSSQKGGSMMDIDNENNNGDQHVTRALQYQSHLRTGNDGNTTHLGVAEAENIARQIEERNIHSLYRLLARIVQLLDLMSLLRRAHNMRELREVDWGRLHGLTYCQLVQTAEGQDRLESLLNGLVTTSASDGPGRNISTAQADQVANLFAKHCYLFFSPGSRFVYFGLREADRALNYDPNSSARLRHAEEAARYFREAAKYWYSAPLVSGRILHRKGKETFTQIAQRAMEAESPLAMATDVLIRLREEIAAVAAIDVCLTTASNFKAHRTFDISDLHGRSNSYDLQWEQHLYHKRRLYLQDGSAQNRSSHSSPSQIIAHGTDVTSRDAVDTCYALIFHWLSMLLNEKSELAEWMVSRCAAETDETFLEEFFSFLLHNEYKDTLLRINSVHLDEWLRSRNDAEMLWRYYNIQGRHKDAGMVAMKHACNEESLGLDIRMKFLFMAKNSYDSALEQLQNTRGNDFSNQLFEEKKDVEETVQVAQIQRRILRTVESRQDLNSKLSESSLRNLQFKLSSVKALYDCSQELELWDELLKILHACRSDDGKTIEIVWRYILSDELLPCATQNEIIQQSLQAFFEYELNNSIIYLPERGRNDSSLMLFDNGAWESSVSRRIISLGKELYGTGFDAVFPVAYLLTKMNELREMIPSVLEASWPLLTLVHAGVPYLEILNQFEYVIANKGHILIQAGDSRRLLVYREAMIELFEEWISSSRTVEYAKNQLVRAIGDGSFMAKIDTIKSDLLTMSETSGARKRLHAIETEIRNIY